MKYLISITMWLILLSAVSFAADQSIPNDFHELKRFELGGEGGWDCLTVDSNSHRIYIARSNRVMVVDLDSGKLVGEISGLEGAHGIALSKETGRGFASSGKTNEVFVFDLSDLHLLKRIRVGENPDIVIFEPVSKLILSFNGKSHDVTVIDPESMQIIGSMLLPGKPEFATDDGSGTVYVNIEDKNALVSFEVKSLKIRSEYQLAPCKEPTGLAMDKRSKRLIVGCSNRVAVTVNAENGKLLQTFKVGSGVDGAAFDQERNLAFVSAGEGTLTILKEKDTSFMVLQDVLTIKGSRTLAVDEKSGHVYLPLAKFETPASPQSQNGHARPVVVPGSFGLLVIGNDADNK